MVWSSPVCSLLHRSPCCWCRAAGNLPTRNRFRECLVGGWNEWPGTANRIRRWHCQCCRNGTWRQPVDERKGKHKISAISEQSRIHEACCVLFTIIGGGVMERLVGPYQLKFIHKFTIFLSATVVYCNAITEHVMMWPD